MGIEIQKYRATIKGSKKEIVGYISEIREHLGNGSYGKGTSYLMTVTEKSMPNGEYGTWLVDENSINKI